ncbi:MAG: 5-aminolevulinate synthase, partial [Proteobacteria bacterium]
MYNTSHPHKERFQELIDQLTAEGRYRVFRTINRRVGDFPRAKWDINGKARDVVIWCSNDYLGMGHHPDVMAAAERAILEFGTGAGGTRNISGT